MLRTAFVWLQIFPKITVFCAYTFLFLFLTVRAGQAGQPAN